MGKKSRFFCTSILILSVIIILVTSLFYKQTKGISDNGDYHRVTYPNRISYVEGQKEWFVFTDSFIIDYKGDSRLDKLKNAVFTFDFKYVTTQHVYIKMSVILNTIVRFLKNSDYRLFNLKWLGVTYSVFFVLAFGIIFSTYKTKRKWLDISFFVLLILVFCDSGYTLYFNSFFGEAAQFASFILALGCAVGAIYCTRLRKLFYVLYYVSVILFMGSKFANIPAGVILAIAGIAFILIERKSKLARTMLFSMTVISLLFSVYLYTNVPKWMEEHNNYHAVFFGILKDSSNPQKDLKDLGLPQYMVELKDTNYFVEDLKVDIHSEKFKEDFDISKIDLVKYYITHPKTLWKEIEVSCKNSQLIRPCYLSNYKSDERMVFNDNYGVWSSLRLKLPLDNIYVVILLFLIGIVVLIYEYLSIRKEKNINNKKMVILLFLFSLWVVNGLNLAMPVMGNGEADLAKHMYAFITGFDLMLIIEIIWLAHKLYSLNVKLFLIKVKDIIVYKKKLVTVVISITITSIFILNLAFNYIEFNRQQSGTQNFLRIGSYIHLGKYNNKNILWKVINKDENGILILSEELLESKAFNSASGEGDKNRVKYGSNRWKESELRLWLNNVFIKSFNEEEIKLILPYKNKVLLSKHDKQYAEGGERELYWIHLPEFINRGCEEAYFEYTNDRVFLLDVDQFNRFVFNNKVDYKKENKYWLETAYYNNSSMVRIVDADGFVYMKDAIVENVGVLPAVYIDANTAILEGNGSVTKPYSLFKYSR